MDKTKDWTGNFRSVFTTLGASNHADGERQRDDYYATDPLAIDKLREVFSEGNYYDAAGLMSRMGEYQRALEYLKIAFEKG